MCDGGGEGGASAAPVLRARGPVLVVPRVDADDDVAKATGGGHGQLIVVVFARISTASLAFGLCTACMALSMHLLGAYDEERTCIAVCGFDE